MKKYTLYVQYGKRGVYAHIDLEAQNSRCAFLKARQEYKKIWGDNDLSDFYVAAWQKASDDKPVSDVYGFKNT